MNNVLIKVIRKADYKDLQEKYENPILHTCSLNVGDEFVSIDVKRPDGLCFEAWKSVKEFVEFLANGNTNLFDGWMKDPDSAMISCNDGFRPVSFLLRKIK